MAEEDTSVNKSKGVLKMLVIYDADDNIITVLEDAQSINSFKNGYYTITGSDHYEEV